MTRLPTLLGFAAAAAALALPVALGAPAAAAGERQCFYVNQITGTKADGMRTVYARTGPHRLWRIDLGADCALLGGGGGKIILTPRGSGSICGPQDFDLGAAGSGGAQRCLVRDIRLLTPQEASAVPQSAQP